MLVFVSVTLADDKRKISEASPGAGKQEMCLDNFGNMGIAEMREM